MGYYPDSQSQAVAVNTLDDDLDLSALLLIECLRSRYRGVLLHRTTTVDHRMLSAGYFAGCYSCSRGYGRADKVYSCLRCTQERQQALFDRCLMQMALAWTLLLLSASSQILL